MNSYDLARFWPKIEVAEGCWPWTGTVKPGSHPYGITAHRIGSGKWRAGRAHRVSWELFVGRIPAGMHVLHRCDNPRCVRPDHLFLGTHKQNMADMHEKGRAHVGSGENARNAKLTWERVAEIRGLHRKGHTQASLATRYGVSPRTVAAAVRFLTWKDPS